MLKDSYVPIIKQTKHDMCFDTIDNDRDDFDKEGSDDSLDRMSDQGD